MTAVSSLTYITTILTITIIFSTTIPSLAYMEKVDNRTTFLHVVNPYRDTACKETFCPFNQEQSVALASLVRAQAETRASVMLAAATVVEDDDIVPKGFFHLGHLTRTTASVYPNLELRNKRKKKLPFAQDIIDRALESDLEFDYLIYSNSDIILHKKFYDIVQNQVDTGLDAFNINRQTISKEKKDGTLFNAEDLEEIYSMVGSRHPGSDCFVIKKSFVERLQMGDVFLGFGGWGLALQTQLKADGAKYAVFGTSKLYATYHLGNDRSWLKEHDYRNQNYRNVMEMERLWCLCENLKRRDELDISCRTLYGFYKRRGHDMSGACPKGLSTNR